MAHHKSAKKRIRQTETRRLHNRFFAVTTRNAIRKLKALEKKEEAQELLPKVVSMIDKVAKKNIIHKSKADNLKSKLQKFVNSLEG